MTVLTREIRDNFLSNVQASMPEIEAPDSHTWQEKILASAMAHEPDHIKAFVKAGHRQRLQPVWYADIYEPRFEKGEWKCSRRRSFAIPFHRDERNAQALHEAFDAWRSESDAFCQAKNRQIELLAEVRTAIAPLRTVEALKKALPELASLVPPPKASVPIVTDHSDLIAKLAKAGVRFGGAAA